MQFEVEPGPPLRGVVAIPGDKSISHRALMLAAIADGISTIDNFLPGEDCLATLRALRSMGVQIESESQTRVRVHGGGMASLRAPRQPLDMGNSGTAMRLLCGLLAGQPFTSTLTGDASLQKRPMNRVITPLESMGASLDARSGRPPLTIHGNPGLRGIDYGLPVASAQVKSAILLAGLFAAGETRVTEPAITRDHTERMLEGMGVRLVRQNGVIRLQGGQQLRATPIDVPGDLSSAAFLMLAATITPGSDVLLSNVGVNPTRTGVIDILRQMGADISLGRERQSGGEPVADIRVCSAALSGIDVDPSLVPLAIDEFPVLFVAAAFASGTTRFTGLAELRVKESDRIAAMAAGLIALGVRVREFDDGAEIEGGQVSGGTVESFGDHRIAMAFAVAGSAAAGAVTILETENVNTSFPGFVQLTQQLGMRIRTAGEESGLPPAAPVITIDGPSGSGKGTIARRVAGELGWHLLDSGALYRLTALAVSQAGAEDADDDSLAVIASNLDVRFDTDNLGEERIFLDGTDVTTAVRDEETGLKASRLAANPAVREALLSLQFGFRQAPGLIADGRDMGTQVFANAGLKVFLTASAEERARRRYKQLKDKGIDVSLPALSRDIEDRDRRDAERSVAPLKPAADARVLDSSDLSIDEVVDIVLDWARQSYPEETEH